MTPLNASAPTTQPTPRAATIATIATYCAAYREALEHTAERPHQDPAMLDRYVAKVRDGLLAKQRTYIHTTPCSVAAWKAIGFKGKPTWKVLFNLPKE